MYTHTMHECREKTHNGKKHNGKKHLDSRIVVVGMYSTYVRRYLHMWMNEKSIAKRTFIIDTGGYELSPKSFGRSLYSVKKLCKGFGKHE